MQTISIHTGLTDPQTGKPVLQIIYTDGLTPEEVLINLRKAEDYVLADVVEAAERRGREQQEREQ